MSSDMYASAIFKSLLCLSSHNLDGTHYSVSLFAQPNLDETHGHVLENSLVVLDSWIWFLLFSEVGGLCLEVDSFSISCFNAKESEVDCMF